MKVAVFSSHSYDHQFFDAANQAAGNPHELVYFETPLNAKTVPLAAGFPAVCIFVNDKAHSEILKTLAQKETKLIVLRCAGFNNVDLETAADLGIKVVRVPVLRIERELGKSARFVGKSAFM